MVAVAVVAAVTIAAVAVPAFKHRRINKNHWKLSVTLDSFCCSTRTKLQLQVKSSCFLGKLKNMEENAFIDAFVPKLME